MRDCKTRMMILLVLEFFVAGAVFLALQGDGYSADPPCHECKCLDVWCWRDDASNLGYRYWDVDGYGATKSTQAIAKIETAVAKGCWEEVVESIYYVEKYECYHQEDCVAKPTGAPREREATSDGKPSSLKKELWTYCIY